ncbi:hypothetical protein GGTG_07605 [Gaeumannomyces tritici R3-111a-1]|uniref:Uncharacterized protein n=1 Tax=Gaeumannomyces tritici (strain R3-111a-1) TaxID=644352 RepID=J3P257_GAET3|nr:hypothetical protein GGTG_07605 [Gaeumannomyces tritici R3-111a-1]EJT73749.1 hypothetical protein GGTG_07605 [Gaeumannomyces tritici R3-111a-1]
MADIHPGAFKALIANLKATNVTKTVHSTSYPAISPLRPELSQAGWTVFITDGTGGLGLAIAKSFVAAGAARVVIVGRRLNSLAAAHQRLEEEAARLSSPSVIIHRQCDVAADADVERLWVDAEVGPVHVLVLNTAAFRREHKSLVDIGYKVVWSYFETNVEGNIHMTESVLLPTLYICHPETAPGAFHTGSATDHIGFAAEDLAFDDTSMPASVAVWLASREARFLHAASIWRPGMWRNSRPGS